jgi:hypothetical protein
MPSFALDVQRGSIPGAPNAMEGCFKESVDKGRASVVVMWLVPSPRDICGT